MKVFVLGTGGWGIALAMLLHHNGHAVTSWTFFRRNATCCIASGQTKSCCQG